MATSQHDTPLHDAARSGDNDNVRDLLQAGAEIDARGDYGETPLHVAAANGQTSIVQLFLERGATIDTRTNNGWTSLHLAASNGNTSTVQLLLERGATIDTRNNDGSTPLKAAVMNYQDETVSFLINAGADIFNVIDDPELISCLTKDDALFLKILKLRINKVIEEPNVDAKKLIFSLLHGYISCRKNAVKELQLKDPIFERLLSHVKNSLKRATTNWEESTVDIKIRSLLKDIDEDKEGWIKKKIKSFGGLLCSFLMIAVNCTYYLLSTYLPAAITTKVSFLPFYSKAITIKASASKVQNHHIVNCHIISIKKVAVYVFLMTMHVYDIATDFIVGYSDVKSGDTSTLGYFMIGLAVFGLCHENIMSGFYLFKVERSVLAEKKKKKESELEPEDWKESQLNFSGTWYKLLFYKVFFPYKVTKLEKEPDTQNNNSDNKCILFFRKWLNLNVLQRISLNLVSFLLLRPVLDRFRIISHEETSIRILEIKKAQQKYLQQSYGILEQLFEILLQMYTLHIALQKSGTYFTDDIKDNIMRISSLLIPLYSLPRGYLSLEKLFRSLDPLSNKLPFYNLFLILYIFITACRVFMISTILHVDSLVNYVFGYLALRIILSICYNIIMYMNWKDSFKDDILKSNTSKFRNIWHFFILSLRQNFILSIRHIYGYILLPHKVSNNSIRDSRHLIIDCLIFSLESVIMLVLSELFHDRSESFKYFYDIGMWAGALVTVLCSCFYIMTIDFVSPKDLFEKVRKDKFSLTIYKQFKFRLGFLAIIGWLYAYLNLKHNLHYQLISYICLAGTFVYVVVYFLIYYIIRKEGKKFQRQFSSDISSSSSDISSSSITASDITNASDFGPFVSSNYTPLLPLVSSDTSLTFSDIYRSIIGDSNDPRSDQSGADPEQLV